MPDARSKEITIEGSLDKSWNCECSLIVRKDIQPKLKIFGHTYAFAGINISNTWIGKSINDLRRIVPGSVVNDQHFKVFEGLCKQTSDGVADKRPAIICR